MDTDWIDGPPVTQCRLAPATSAPPRVGAARGGWKILGVEISTPSPLHPQKGEFHWAENADNEITYSTPVFCYPHT